MTQYVHFILNPFLLLEQHLVQVVRGGLKDVYSDYYRDVGYVMIAQVSLLAG